MQFQDSSQATSSNYSTENVSKTKFSSKYVENWNQSATLVTKLPWLFEVCFIP